MVVKVSKWDHGAFSPEWMTKALVRHMDRPSLDMAVFALIDFVGEVGEISYDDLLQVLVQVSATHNLVQTFDPYELDDESLTDGDTGTSGLPTKEAVDEFFNNLKIDRALAPKDEEDNNDND